MAVKEGWRGRFFEDFEVGDVYEHPLGRTVTTTDNICFTLLSQNTAPTWLPVVVQPYQSLGAPTSFRIDVTQETGERSSARGLACRP